MQNRVEDVRDVPAGPSWFKLMGVLQLLGLPDDPPGIIGRKLPRPATDQWHQVAHIVELYPASNLTTKPPGHLIMLVA